MPLSISLETDHSLQQAVSPSQIAERRTLGGPPTVSPHPSRSESPAQLDSFFPTPTGPGPTLFGYPAHVFLRDDSPMAEMLACSKPNWGHAHAPPAAAMPACLSQKHALPRRGQSFPGPRWSRRLTLPPGPSLVSRRRPRSSSPRPYRPVLAISDIHRPTLW